MAYATSAEVQTYIGLHGLRRSSDRDGNGVPDPATISLCVNGASGQIDDYLRGAPSGYTLPLATTPDRIKQICIMLTVYHLFWDSISKDIRDQYVAALSDLEKYRKGDLKLDDALVGDGAAFDMDYNDPLMTREGMERF